ncbi:pentapeptide repeat-containing protein [Oligoflexus tunisiensis]|uniref:pentapeptide repeat-containing protein n=1 Tax=Oligoflexus tunisiensis TaxID=708132 RepID=UPI00114CAA1B|nr:pentapeptide repeat-containing protein [Oligoflexus tunisiensis]
MYASLLVILILSMIPSACSSSRLRGKSASADTDIPDKTVESSEATITAPFSGIHDCKVSAPPRVCGLASLAAELQTVDSLGNSQTLHGIRLASRKTDQQAWQDLTLQASCLSENSFVQGQWDRAVFQGSEMILTELSRTAWRQASFKDSDLRLSHFADADITELNVKNTCLAAVNWSATRFQDVSIEDSAADFGNFSAIVSQGRFAFVRGRLIDSNFSYASFEGDVDFQDSDMRGVNLTGATFNGTVNWQGAQLSGALWMDGRVCAEGSIGQCN